MLPSDWTATILVDINLYVCEWLYCRDLLTNLNRSDYSLALEKLHQGTAGNDEAFSTLTCRYS